MTELKHTAALMRSNDYKERFIAEYLQLKIRVEKLENMLKEWDAGRLNFVPTCPRSIYNDQLDGMKKYLSVLISRAKIESINLEQFNDIYVIQEIKLLRNEIKSISADCLSLGHTEELRQVITKLKEARMWLGCQLALVGEINPYPDGNDITSSKINPST